MTMFEISKLMRSRDRGAALVETAMILLLVLLLIAGLADLGRAFNEYIVIGEASHAGARYGSMNPSDADGTCTAVIQMAAYNGVTVLREVEEGLTATCGETVTNGDITITGLGCQPGDPIRVTVTHQFPTIMGGIIGFETITMTCATEMAIVGATP